MPFSSFTLATLVLTRPPPGNSTSRYEVYRSILDVQIQFSAVCLEIACCHLSSPLIHLQTFRSPSLETFFLFTSYPAMLTRHVTSQHFVKASKRILAVEHFFRRQVLPGVPYRTFTDTSPVYQAHQTRLNCSRTTASYVFRRNFLSPPSNPFSPSSSEPQILHARRNLPYPQSELYELIADIPSYSTFLPFCTGARILSYSSPDISTGSRHPALASLSVGWKGITEEFVSRVYCIPGDTVEAISGSQGASSLKREELEKWGYGNSISAQDTSNGIFEALATRWSLDSSKEGKGTEVDLRIEIVWKNALYAAMAKAASEKVAGVMIHAFEERAKSVLG